MGKILSEMAVIGKTNHDIAMFTINRPAIEDSNYKPQFSVYDSSVYDMNTAQAKL